jgi:hypothetical protein
LVALRAARRWSRLDARFGWARRASAVLAVLGVVALLPPLAVTAAEQISGYVDLARPQLPLWAAIMRPGLGPLTAIAALALLASLFVIAAARTAPADEA